MPQALIPLVWLVVSPVKSGMATQAGRLSDRIHPRTALAAGWLWQQGPHGPSWAFGATAVLSVLACGLLMAPIGPTVVGGE